MYPIQLQPELQQVFGEIVKMILYLDIKWRTYNNQNSLEKEEQAWRNHSHFIKLSTIIKTA